MKFGVIVTFFMFTRQKGGKHYTLSDPMAFGYKAAIIREGKAAPRDKNNPYLTYYKL